MSEGNVEVVRRTFEAFQRGGPEAMLVELFSDDVITYRHEPDRATLYGEAGFRDAVADWTEDFSEWQVVSPGVHRSGRAGPGSGSPGSAGEKQRRPCGGGLVVPLRADRWQGVEDQLLFQPRRSPRSRRAVGVARGWWAASASAVAEAVSSAHEYESSWSQRLPWTPSPSATALAELLASPAAGRGRVPGTSANPDLGRG